ncbi:hypothetical protein BJF85_23095 [Saccharomonospora sp. CUA-673]|uniref:nuclear transport factor 2 family protein n=1 Tax=Saccharomonospora sp. CUA-673 TaxID=1904969 RepID=UPI0009667CAD|nr:nuclear transport factor 2 family protein [Saccharomonospora sp. CUA-673]OLT42427.1 hypothetical protein BJF85_23095 [Saccharomonospora sp. CUA-673]
MDEQRLREFADRAELADLVARHSAWIDEGRFDDTTALFTPDVVVTSIRGRAEGIAELVELARRSHERYVRTLHSKSNLIIDIEGDTAIVRAHDIAVFVLDDATQSIAAGVHVYGARRTDAGWRFDRLDITPLALTEPLPTDPAVAPGR